MRNLATIPQELRRWLRSAKQHEVDLQPLARLQNPESQARYASYIVKFLCFYLRIIADERRVDEDLSQRSQAVDSSDEASSEDSGTETEYDDSDKDNAGSTDNDSIAPPRRPRKNVQVDKMKDARELFSWKDDQKALAVQL